MDRTGEDGPGNWQSDLADLSDMPLGEVTTLPTGDDSAFARGLRRLAAEPDDPIAGFNSAL